MAVPTPTSPLFPSYNPSKGNTGMPRHDYPPYSNMTAVWFSKLLCYGIRSIGKDATKFRSTILMCYGVRCSMLRDFATRSCKGLF